MMEMDQVAQPAPPALAEQPLRVAIFALQFAPLVGGAETQALTLARELLARGHQVRVFTLRFQSQWPRREVIDGVPVTRIGGMQLRCRLKLGFGSDWLSYLNTWRALWQARRELDLLHVTTITPWAGVAALFGRLTGKPVLVRCSNVGPDSDSRVQVGDEAWLYPGTPAPDQLWKRVPPRSWVGGDLTTMRSWWPAWLLAQRALHARHVHFLAISSRTARYLARYAYAPARIHVIPNTVHLPLAAAPRATALTAPRVVCVARHNYEKGVDVLLAAWQIVRVRYPAARLLLAGGGRLLEAHRALADASGLGDSVAFLDNYHMVPELLHSADYFVLPSRWEGMPNALLEACAHGLPCVATRVSGSEDIITDGVSGLLVPPLDHVALADALLRFLDDPALAEQCAQQARLTVAARYQPDMVLAQYLTLVHQLSGSTFHMPATVEAAV